MALQTAPFWGGFWGRFFATLDSDETLMQSKIVVLGNMGDRMC